MTGYTVYEIEDEETGEVEIVNWRFVIRSSRAAGWGKMTDISKEQCAVILSIVNNYHEYTTQCGAGWQRKVCDFIRDQRDHIDGQDLALQVCEEKLVRQGNRIAELENIIYPLKS